MRIELLLLYLYYEEYRLLLYLHLSFM